MYLNKSVEHLYPFICDGHLGCFHALPTVNSAAMKFGMQCLFELWSSQGLCPVVIAGSYDSSIFSF